MKTRKGGKKKTKQEAKNVGGYLLHALNKEELIKKNREIVGLNGGKK